MAEEKSINLNRQEIYNAIAANLASSYNIIRQSGIDSGMSGGVAENILINWIKTWIPSKISPISGAAISIKEGPTNQMDCLLFDNVHNPKFGTIQDISILPIEGVNGAIELNYGESTSYQKIEHDCEKLHKLLMFNQNRLQKPTPIVAQVPFNPDIFQITQVQINAGLHYHFQTESAKLQTIIFVEDINGSIEEAAKRIAKFNEKVGIEYSIDGLFVLKQGFALHIHPKKTGWVTSRNPGTKFGYLKASEGITLLRFQSIILKHLYLSSKIHSEGFDQYFMEVGQAAKEMEDCIIVSSSEYINQPGRPGIIQTG